MKPTDLADVNRSDASLAAVDKLLDQYKGQDEIPGLREPATWSKAIRHAGDFFGGPGSTAERLDTKEEIRNRTTAENLVATIIQSISGAGVSNEERERLTDMVRGARTKSDLVNIQNIIRTRNTEQRRLIGGGQAKGPEDTSQGERSEE